LCQWIHQHNKSPNTTYDTSWTHLSLTLFVNKFFYSLNLYFFNSLILQFFNSSILQFFNSSILQFFNSSLLQFFNSTILQFFNSSILQSFNSFSWKHNFLKSYLTYFNKNKTDREETGFTCDILNTFG
jgi:hypothetical protein